jgi:hypothetical protein
MVLLLLFGAQILQNGKFFVCTKAAFNKKKIVFAHKEMTSSPISVDNLA